MHSGETWHGSNKQEKESKNIILTIKERGEKCNNRIKNM